MCFNKIFMKFIIIDILNRKFIYGPPITFEYLEPSQRYSGSPGRDATV